ncbi:hypothetical protein [Yersinia mollaretii]|nr:hypothetical protein [Yersinia mollaretii]MDN0109618.1 hypothetical protein [Yersinia mollaretii]
MSKILKIDPQLTFPPFVHNNIKDSKDDQSIDIPAGRFVDLRVQMPEKEAFLTE